MKLSYLSPYPVPAAKADAMQDVAMCVAFSTSGVETTLVHVSDPSADSQPPASYYGWPECFEAISVGAGKWVPGIRWFESLARSVNARLLERRCFRAAVAAGPDVLYTRDPLAARRAVERLPDVCVVWEAVSIPAGRRYQEAIADLLRSRCIVFALSDGLKADLDGSAPQGRLIEVLPPGVDLDRYTTEGVREHATRERFALPPRTPLALYTGGLRTDRGIGIVLGIAQQMPNVAFAIVGGRDSERRALHEAVRNGGIANVYIREPVKFDEISALQMSADVLLLPLVGASTHLASHTYPAKIPEYLASGVPVVASDIPSIRNAVGPHRAMLVPNDAAAWETAIRRVLRSREIQRELTSHATRFAKSLSWNLRAQRVLGSVREQSSMHTDAHIRP